MISIGDKFSNRTKSESIPFVDLFCEGNENYRAAIVDHNLIRVSSLAM